MACSAHEYDLSQRCQAAQAPLAADGELSLFEGHNPSLPAGGGEVIGLWRNTTEPGVRAKTV